MTVRDAVSGDLGESRTTGPAIFVTVGTDHHPFDRVVRWADAYAAANSEARVVVQYGSATPPVVAVGHESLPYVEMRRQMAAADVVVTQGGPGGIMDSRAVGRLPIVIPRTAALGEHVDDHQVAFAEHMHAHGRIALATDETTFVALIAEAVENPERFAVRDEQSPTATTVVTIEKELGELLGRPPRSFRLRLPRPSRKR